MGDAISFSATGNDRPFSETTFRISIDAGFSAAGRAVEIQLGNSNSSANVDDVSAYARKWLRINRLISLIPFGTPLAIDIPVKRPSETNSGVPIEVGQYQAVALTVDDVKHLRHLLHELANVFTGIMVTGGLLHQALKGDLRQRYSAEICTGSDRGAVLVREAREVLLSPLERLQRP